MNITISNSSRKPIYEQITSQIKNMIISGQLSAGDPLPSMWTLARELRISAITVKRVCNDLKQEGFVRTITDKGSFVVAKDTEVVREGNLQIAKEYLAKVTELTKKNGILSKELMKALELTYNRE